jgi:hypothetical protein
VHWAPGIPHALCFQKGERVWQISGASALRSEEACPLLRAEGTALSIVIVRHRAGAKAPPMTGSSGRSSVPETSAMESIARGVLDTAFAGMTAVLGALRGTLGRVVPSRGANARPGLAHGRRAKDPTDIPRTCGYINHARQRVRAFGVELDVE